MADEVRRTRSRRLRFKDEDLYQRARKMVDGDEANRSVEMDARLQRYAKYRMWRNETVTEPWPGASNVALTDMFVVSQRTQDTLHNAILSARPVMQAKPTAFKDREKAPLIDQTLDYQLLIENGQGWIGELLESFINDGHFTAFLPWVRDVQNVTETHQAPPIPDEVQPIEYFVQLVKTKWPEAEGLFPVVEVDPWDFKLQVRGEEWDLGFYTTKDGVELVVRKPTVVFDGPKVIVKDRSDVLHPSQAANLQPPGPSNPNGAAHVIIVDRPTVAEIEQLWRDGRYDKLTREDIDAMEASEKFEGPSTEGQQRKEIEGEGDAELTEVPKEQRRVTRWMIFDRLAMNAKQPSEEVVYYVIKEHQKLCRIRRLSEEFPSTKFRRPFAEDQFLPVKGRRTGIGALEMVEPLQDQKKLAFDMGFNHGTLLLSPFGFYRPTSSLKPEVMRALPGELYPLSDPQADVNFPRLPSEGQAFAINAITLLDQMEEKATMIGDFQLGRVPRGKASALRTAEGMARIAGQGEERPERILRRLFHGLGQIWEMAHDLNRFFLSDQKRIRISLPLEPGQDPYRDIDRKDIDTVVEFEFSANAFNVSRSALQEALAQIGAFISSPLSIQAGMTTPDTLYAYGKEWIRAWGQDPDKYMMPPSGELKVTVEEALSAVLDYQMPIGVPHEGPLRHLEKLQKFMASDLFGVLNQQQAQLLWDWVKLVQQMAVALLRQQQQMAGQKPAGGEDQGQQGAGEQDTQQAPVEANEMMDETMPMAGGGGNQDIQR